MALKYWVLTQKDDSGKVTKARMSWFSTERADQIRDGQDPDWAMWTGINGPYTHDEAYREALRLKPADQGDLF